MVEMENTNIRSRLFCETSNSPSRLFKWATLAAALALTALLQGCASSEKFRAQMNANLGLSIGQVQEAYGYTNTIRELKNNRKAYTWTWVETGITPAMSTPSFIRTYESDTQKVISIEQGTFFPPEPYVTRCEFTFYVNAAGIVESWRAQGPGCKSYRGPAEVMRSSPQSSTR